MRAVVYAGNGEVALDEVPDPHLVEPTDALVEVTFAGVCGTDLHLLAHPDQLPVGTVLGHEYVGSVVAVGSAVTHLRPGDRVAGADYVACGGCWWCRQGRHWQCPERRFHGTGRTFGPELAGTQADFVRVPFADTALRSLPAQLNTPAAVLLGDVLATGYAGATSLGLRPGECVGVIGGGPVGLVAAGCAQLGGAGKVIVVEPVELRRAAAREIGCYTADPDDFADLAHELTEGRGVDAVIDAVGGEIGLQSALVGLRNAGRICSLGVPGGPSWSMPVADCFAREISIRFAVGDFMRDADALADVLASGLVVPDALVGGVPCDLSEAPLAYRAMKERTTLKSILRVAEDVESGVTNVHTR